MAEINRAVNQLSDSHRGENEATNHNLRTRLFAGLTAVGLSATAFFNVAPANADEVVGAGGMGDPTSRAYEDMLRKTGQLGPNDTYHPVENPASIWPMGPVTAGETVRQGVANGHAVLNHAIRSASPGEKVVIRGYSEGGMIAAELARQHYGDAVARGTVIIDSAPVTEAGMFNPQNDLVKQFLPLAVNMLDVPAHIRAPQGSIVRGSEQDVWFNGGPSDIPRLISQGMDTFMGPAHAVQNPGAPYYVVMGADGIERHVFPGMGTGGIPPMGITMGGPGVLPPPAPAPEARPRPNSPNFRAVSHDWQRRHPERYPEFAAKEAAKAERKASQDNSRTVATRPSKGGTSKNTTSYSKKFEPPVKAPQATRLNRK